MRSFFASRAYLVTLGVILLAVPIHSAWAVPACAGGNYEVNTFICSAANTSDPTSENYCTRTTFTSSSVHACTFNTQPDGTTGTLCISRTPSNVTADLCLERRSRGECQGPCTEAAFTEPSVTSPTPTPELSFPRLQVPFGDLILQPFTKPHAQADAQGNTFLEVDYLAKYLGALYTYLIGIASIAAGLMIVWAGVSWLTSAGNPENISEAKHKIENALIGLVLILGSYTVIKILNPALVLLKPLRVEYAAPEILEPPHGGGELRAGASITDPWRLQSCDGLATSGESFQAYFTTYFKPEYGNPSGYTPAFILADPRDHGSGNTPDTIENSAFFCAVAMECKCPHGGIDSSKRCYSGGKWSRTGERQGWAPCAPFDATTSYCGESGGGSLIPGQTVAADKDCFSQDTGRCEVIVDGGAHVKITDSGSGIRGKRFDLWTGTSRENNTAISAGVHTVRVVPGTCEQRRPYRGGQP